MVVAAPHPCIVTAHDRLVVAVSRVFIPSSDFNALGPEILYSRKTQASRGMKFPSTPFQRSAPVSGEFQDAGAGAGPGALGPGAGADEGGILYERGATAKNTSISFESHALESFDSKPGAAAATAAQRSPRPA